MFQGFNDATVKYYEAIRRENRKSIHKENLSLYLEGVKYPLEELYYELYDYFCKVDRDLTGNKRRCISSAYNDARFCRDEPIKEYFYVRFKLDKADKKNALGFFIDASLDGYKYGLNIYNQDARGMDKIRDYIVDNRHFSTKVIQQFNDAGLLYIQGEKYKRTAYQDENPILKEWLGYKNFSFVFEDRLTPIFFRRELLECICNAYDSAKDLYYMLKEAFEKEMETSKSYGESNCIMIRPK